MEGLKGEKGKGKWCDNIIIPKMYLKVVFINLSMRNWYCEYKEIKKDNVYMF